MKIRLATAVALSLAFSQIAAAPAMAQEPAFRSVERQSFSTQDLQRYGLSAEEAAQVAAYQDRGYQVQVMTPEEAQQYTGGQFTSTQWLVIGLLVIVVAVAVAAD